VWFSKYLEFLGLCDHVYSLMAIVHLDCLLSIHKWKDISHVHNIQILESNPLNILFPWKSSNEVQRCVNWKDWFALQESQEEILNNIFLALSPKLFWSWKVSLSLAWSKCLKTLNNIRVFLPYPTECSNLWSPKISALPDLFGLAHRTPERKTWLVQCSIPDVSSPLDLYGLLLD
jgi:hypothetical protein